MTYNFDPDRWLADRREALVARHRRGELDDGELTAALDELECRYQELVRRLDGTYDVAASSPAGKDPAVTSRSR